jgi:hypothetical protein
MIFSSFVKGLSRKWIKKNLPPLFGRCISSLFYSDLLKTIIDVVVTGDFSSANIEFLKSIK